MSAASRLRDGIKGRLPRPLHRLATTFLDLVQAKRRARKRRWRERDRDREAAQEECAALIPELFGDAAADLAERWDVLLHAIEAARQEPDGLWLEFGVHEGESLLFIARHAPAPVFGFDSFEGLPGDWRLGAHEMRPAGTFALERPPAAPENTVLVAGRFEDVLPAFVAAHHVLRITLLIATLPLLLRWATRR